MTLTILFIVLTGISSYMAWQNRMMLGKAMLIPTIVKNKAEWHRLITHGFIHRGFWHAFINLFVLWMFGDLVEEVYGMRFGSFGPLLFAVLYLGGIVAAALPVYWKRQDDAHYASLGASGAVSGVVFAYILMAPTSMIYLYAIVPIPAVLAGILFVAYSSYKDRRGGDNVAHDAHLYGALWGAAFTLALDFGFGAGITEDFMDQIGAWFR